MIDISINEEEKRVYIDVGGFISKQEAINFLNTHKNVMKNKKASLYKLIVTPSLFECEEENDMKMVCMHFFKAGYRKIYIVDKDNHIMKDLSLKPIERKVFLKAVKIIDSKDSIK